MAMLLQRKAVVPVWVLVLGLFGLFGPSMTFSTGTFVIFIWGLALTIMLVWWKAPTPSIAEVVRDVRVSHTERSRVGADRTQHRTRYPRGRIHMRSARVPTILTISLACLVMSAPLVSGQDLSTYREYQLGMSPAIVAQHAGIAPETRVIHHRPELIEELVWIAPLGLSSIESGDSARKILFSFYNGELYRIVVDYAWDRTEGLTVEDVVDALSRSYGPAALPAVAIGTSAIRPPIAGADSASDRIVARWEDVQHALSLVRPAYASTFGLVMSSKPLDALARAASAHGIGLDERDAPRRAVERQKEREDTERARQETVRRANKATFRP